MGLRMAVLETQAEYEEAKTFLQQYESLWGKGTHVWIGLERDLSSGTHSYKWIDGTPLSYASFGQYPWKDVNTPADDLSKACIKLDWGSGLLFKPHECTATMDFLCEGFYLYTNALQWTAAKSDCEANSMNLASLNNQNTHEAASLFINVKRSITSSSMEKVWYGLKCTSGMTYYHEDGSGAITYGSTYNSLPWNSGDPDGCMCGRLKRYDSNNDGLYQWTDKECSDTFPYLCKDVFSPLVVTTPTPAPPTTTTTTAAPPQTTTTAAPTTSTLTETTTKPWWFVEYSADGKAIGKNGKTFDKSSPPARFGIVGIAIGLATFSFITVAICMLWFCCLRGKSEYKEQEGDGDEEEEDEKRRRQKRKVSPMEVKPHGLKYIA
ncbi:C-type mannose receptor 2-like isoform X2 [Crassostrea virginica]